MNNPSAVVWLDDKRCRDAAQVGSKAASLATLADAGFRVPPGFCIHRSALDAYVDSPGASALRRAIDVGHYE